MSEPSIPGIASLWELTTGSPDIRIAVLDGGVDTSHPCFNGSTLQEIPTLATNAEGNNSTRHGTQVASLIFGQHGSAVTGIAPNCTGLIIPIFEEHKGQRLASNQLDLARAIQKAVAEKVQVINISAGQLSTHPEPDMLLKKALQSCVDNNILVVAAAGNDGCDCLHVPAASPNVLAVGAHDATGQPQDFSNWGSAYQKNGILAPGSNLTTALPGNGIAQTSGTSFAAPIVSGIAGLLLSLQVQRGLKPFPALIKHVLLQTADACTASSADVCQRFLAGTLNVKKVLTYVMSPGELPGSSINQSSITNQLHTNVQNIESMDRQNQLLASVAATAAEVPADTTHVVPSEAIASQEPAAAVSSSSETEPVLQAAGDSVTMEPEAALASTGQDTVLPSEAKPVEINAAVLTPNLQLNENAPAVATSQAVVPSDCGCGGKSGSTSGGSTAQPARTKVYAIGTIGYDVLTESRRDSLLQHFGEDPMNPQVLLKQLKKDPSLASEILWTLNVDDTPVYGIVPHGRYAPQMDQLMMEFLTEQLNGNVDRVAIPGIIAGKGQLISGANVPAVVPNLRGMASWTTPELVKAVAGTKVSGKEREAINNFLTRVYFELRNLGVASEERAINFAATNAFQAKSAFQQAMAQGMELSTIEVEKTPVARPHADSWDVKLTFFDPTARFEKAQKVFRFTIDVSDVVPVTVGAIKSWSVY